MKWSNHFIERCKEKAPELARKGKGGVWTINEKRLAKRLDYADEIERSSSIHRLLRYGEDDCRYILLKSPQKKQQLILVENSNGVYVTVYQFQGSWAEKEGYKAK